MPVLDPELGERENLYGLFANVDMVMEKRISSSEEKYGFIRLPKPIQRGEVPRAICILCGGEKREVHMDVRFRVYVGRGFFRKYNLKPGMIVDLEWVGLNELKIEARGMEALTEEPKISRIGRPEDIVGEPINFRGFVYAPLNEAGVILLFSKVMDDLGIIYEASPSKGIDLIARRRRPDGTYERVRIEFEYKSSNFKRHGHDPSMCDIIVCWEHDWPDCPLEVIELKSVIKRLPP